MASDETKRDDSKTAEPTVETDKYGIPLVPRLGDARRPSINTFEDVLRANRALLSAREGLSGGKRSRPVTLHFTLPEYALLEACASYTGGEVAPFVRRMFFAELREMFP